MERDAAMADRFDEERAMSLTREFKDLVRKRADRDPAFRDALLRENVDTPRTGDGDKSLSVIARRRQAG